MALKEPPNNPRYHLNRKGNLFRPWDAAAAAAAAATASSSVLEDTKKFSSSDEESDSYESTNRRALRKKLSNYSLHSKQKNDSTLSSSSGIKNGCHLEAKVQVSMHGLASTTVTSSAHHNKAYGSDHLSSSLTHSFAHPDASRLLNHVPNPLPTNVLSSYHSNYHPFGMTDPTLMLCDPLSAQRLMSSMFSPETSSSAAAAAAAAFFLDFPSSATSVNSQFKKKRPKRFQCPHCQVSFSNNGQLRGHIRIHTGKYLLTCVIFSS